MWVAYKTIVIKDVLRFARIWVQTIFPPIITTSLYLLIFGGLMGERIGQMQGVDYLQYIIPGIILMTVITNSYSNTVMSFFLAKFNHSIEELLVSPVPYWVILLGYISGGVVRGFVVGLSVFITVSFFVEINVDSIWITSISFLLTAILFSLAGFLNANKPQPKTINHIINWIEFRYVLPKLWQDINTVKHTTKINHRHQDKGRNNGDIIK